MSIEPADRISQFSEYYFSQKLRNIAELRASGRDIINLGIGSPDLDPDSAVLAEMTQALSVSGVHGYQPYQGISELRKAIFSFYQQHYKTLPNDAQALPLMGSKEGVTHISLAYLNPGDEVLIPSLGYPTYTSVTKMVGAKPIFYPLTEEKWLPDWAYLERIDCSKVKIMWINYPHMPTGKTASLALLSKLVDFARRNDILLCHDNPYSFILNKEPMSIFNVDGADEICLELSSLSKTFNMAGWRVGWVMGRDELVAPVLQIKSNMDSGMFKPIQLAAISALQLDQNWFASLEMIYRKRQKIGFKIMKALACEFDTNQSGMFIWAKAPNQDGERFIEDLLIRSNVFIAPGMIFGEAGVPYVRLSLCASEEVLEEAYQRVI